jgi:hypothetical protein
MSYSGDLLHSEAEDAAGVGFNDSVRSRHTLGPLNHALRDAENTRKCERRVWAQEVGERCETEERPGAGMMSRTDDVCS